eukprot:TRINITY_DN9397_c0_g1_i2.p1 TRINITY_DN9397_c0_g1~~TRINITY_DN9397_c0_g1_i2.p1  ORF type:complete len:438 (+),score=46.60 TRINITY_DN9397_c0_g1_i2:42-1316(+)
MWRVLRVPLALLLAVLVRCAFFLQTTDDEEPLSASFSLRAELSSPVTSLRTVDEGLFVWSLNGSPYLGSAFHQQPLVLLLGLLPGQPKILRGLVFIATDILIGLLLWAIATMHSKENPTFQRANGSKPDPFWALLLYLFNPLAVINCGSVSTGIFTNLFVMLSLLLAYQGKASLLWSMLSMIVGSVAVYLEISLFILLVPLIYVTTRHSKRTTSLTLSLVFVFMLSLGSLWISSYIAMGNSWEFLDSTYGFVFELRDLRPNIGLFWYFFAEVFLRYRTFFLFAFHLHPLTYVVPFATHFGDRLPLFYFWSLVAVVSIFKAYPTVSDVVLYLSFIPILAPLFENIPFLSTVVTVYLFCIAIAPVMWHAWLVKGSGNANFYYAGTLVFKLVEQYVVVGAIVEVLRNRLKRGGEEELNQGEVKAKRE